MPKCNHFKVINIKISLLRTKKKCKFHLLSYKKYHKSNCSHLRHNIQATLQNMLWQQKICKITVTNPIGLDKTLLVDLLLLLARFSILLSFDLLLIMTCPGGPFCNAVSDQ